MTSKGLSGTFTSRNLFWLVILVVILIIVPFFIKTSHVRLITEAAIMGLFAMAWNLTLGATGLFSFGHGGLFGIGVYTVAIAMVKGDVPMPYALIAAPIFSGVAAFFIGLICTRLTGLYFAILTLAFSQLIWSTIWKLRDFTGGDDGITGVILPSLVNTPIRLYFFALVVVALAVTVIWLLLKSPLGFTLNTIRENERRAEAIGINIRRYKILAFSLSGFFSGLAGGLFALYMQGAFVEFASVTKCFDPVFACIIGGIWTFPGPVVGATIWLALDTFVQQYTEYWPLVSGIILILLILFLPMGLVGSLQDWFRERRLKKKQAYEALTAALKPESASDERKRREE